MTDDFAALYDYNRWANGKLLEACRTLTDEQYGSEPVPGWSSVRSSLVHIAVATEGWLRGLSGEKVDRVPTEAEMPTVEDAARLLARADEIVAALLPAMTPEKLAAPVTLRRGDRSVVLPPWAVLRHLVNHATYHRGQVASKLKRFGVEPPATDFIFWVFAQGPAPA